jgi:hypothetical protein
MDTSEWMHQRAPLIQALAEAAQILYPNALEYVNLKEFREPKEKLTESNLAQIEYIESRLARRPDLIGQAEALGCRKVTFFDGQFVAHGCDLATALALKHCLQRGWHSQAAALIATLPNQTKIAEIYDSIRNQK